MGKISGFIIYFVTRSMNGIFMAGEETTVSEDEEWKGKRCILLISRSSASKYLKIELNSMAEMRVNRSKKD